MIELTKKPKNVTIIEGFPGIGLVGTIATGFLIDHLDCEKIGRIYFVDAPPTIAIHGCNVIDPVTIYYNKKYNVVIIHSITAPTKIEWQAAEAVLDVCKQLQPKELITIEGVGAQSPEPKTFYYTDNHQTRKQFEKLGVKCLGEGVVIGVTAGIMMKNKKFKLTNLFAEAAAKLPDSKAAANMIKTLDKYLGLKVNYEPLLKQAEAFEDKLKGLIKHAEIAQQSKDMKQLSYLG